MISVLLLKYFLGVSFTRGHRGQSMKFFFAKVIPYILTFFAGAAVFFLSVYRPSIWSDWLVEISGALSAIPIVFLIYEYSNYKLTNRVDKKLADNLTFEINSVMLRVLRFYRDAMKIRPPISWGMIEKMLDMPVRVLKKELHLHKKDIEVLRQYKNALDDLVYKSADASVFEPTQFEIAATLPRELSHIINELEFRASHEELAQGTKSLFSAINNWFDSCEEQALKNHSHFQLIGTPIKKIS